MNGVTMRVKKGDDCEKNEDNDYGHVEFSRAFHKILEKKLNLKQIVEEILWNIFFGPLALSINWAQKHKKGVCKQSW